MIFVDNYFFHSCLPILKLVGGGGGGGGLMFYNTWMFNVIILYATRYPISSAHVNSRGGGGYLYMFVHLNWVTALFFIISEWKHNIQYTIPSYINGNLGVSCLFYKLLTHQIEKLQFIGCRTNHIDTWFVSVTEQFLYGSFGLEMCIWCMTNSVKRYSTGIILILFWFQGPRVVALGLS